MSHEFRWDREHCSPFVAPFNNALVLVASTQSVRLRSWQRQERRSAEVDECLAQLLIAMAKRVHPGLAAGCRYITPADEFALTGLERAPLARAVPSVRRATGAGRIVAKGLLKEVGAPAVEHLRRLASGSPAWPAGYTGSISHDSEFAVAAVARSGDLCSVGIDVEPSLPLPAELLALVATPAERRQLDGDLLLARMLFSIKEAVYKTTHPIDGQFLDHHDVEVCLATCVARTATGYTLPLQVAIAPRVVALAAWPADSYVPTH